MKRRTIIISITTLIILGLGVPYFTPAAIQQYVENVSTLISLSSTVLTLTLAMILYNQMGLDQTLLQKKAEVVFKLLDLLNERSFTVKTNLNYSIYIFLTTISKHKKDYQRYGQLKVLFNKDYLEYVRPIIELEQNVFLPKELFIKILKLEPTLFKAEANNVDDPGYACVAVTGREFMGKDLYPNISEGEWGSIMFIGEDSNLKTELTMEEFIDRWDDLIISSIQWINKFSSYQELNIPFFRDYYKTKK